MKNMYKKISVALLLAAGSIINKANAQVSTYSFAQSTGTYTPLTGATVLATATGNTATTSLDDATYSAIIPFAFMFDGTAQTAIRVSTNGFISFGTITPVTTNYAPISSTVAYAGCVSAWGRNISSVFNIAGKTGEISYTTTGVTPNRVFTVQWANFRPRNSVVTTNVYTHSFQIQLKETSNTVAIIYDAGAYLAGSTAITGANVQVGLRGAINADFNNRINSTTTAFTASTAGTINTDTKAFNTTATIPGMPTAGLTYTWTPPVPCTGTPSLTAIAGITNVCPSTLFTLSSTTTSTLGGLSLQWYSSANGTTYFPIVGAQAVTYTEIAGVLNKTWYKLVAKCTYSNLKDSVTTIVNVSPFYACYTCGNALHIFASRAIDSVYIQSTTLAHADTGISSNTLLGYSRFAPTINATANLDLGSTYKIGVMEKNTAATMSLWIDYNKNGSFDSLEWTDVARNSIAGDNAVLFTLPQYVTSTDTGLTGMRIRTRNSPTNFATDACTQFGSGETQDYIVRLVQGPCVTTTAAGIVKVSDSTFINLGNNYAIVAGQSGSYIHWQYATLLAGPYKSVPNYNNNDSLLLNITTFTPGKYYFRAVMTSAGCTQAISNIDSTIVTYKCIHPTSAGLLKVADTSLVNGTPISYAVVSGQTGDSIMWQYSTSLTGTYAPLPNSVNNDSVIISLAPGVYYIQAVMSSLACTSTTSNADSTIVILKGDNVCDAIPLTFGTSALYSNAGTTIEAGEPTAVLNWFIAPNNTLWFKFVAPTTGMVRIQSPAFDTQLALWDAATCDSLLSPTGVIEIASNDDDDNYIAHGGVEFSSYIDSVKCLTPGKTYYISLDGYSTITGITTIILTKIAVDTTFAGVGTTVCAGAAPISLVAPANGVFTSAHVVGNVYTPSLTATKDTIKYAVYGCYTSTQIINVAKPTVNITGTTAVCAGVSTTLTATGATTFAWTAGPTTAAYSVTPTINTTYEVIGTDAFGCKDTATQVVNVNALPAAPIIVATAPAITCTITKDTLLATNYTSGLTWSTGAITPKLITATAGTFTAKYTDANGCVSPLSNTVTVANNTGVSVAVTTSKDSICVGGTANLTAIGNALNYTWTPATGLSTTTGTSTIATPITTTTYVVTADDGAGCSVKDSVKITIVPNAIVTVTPASSVVTTTGSNVSNPVTVTGATTFDFTTATTGVGTHQALSGTNYLAAYTINDSVGATSIGSGTVSYTVVGYNVIGCPSAPVTAVVNIASVVGLANANVDASINVFPNPTSNVINVIANGSILNVVIINANGKVVKQATTFDNTIKLAVNDVTSGTYSLRITTEQGTTVKQIVITK
jgi:hypothetical protein